MTPATRIIPATDADTATAALLVERGGRYVVITDTTVEKTVLPRLRRLAAGATCVIAVPPGEASKSVEGAVEIWRRLVEACLTRHDTVVCVGGGVVTDLGGFAASTFKRGIATVNVPTTLLGAVDAAAGGKTGIDFLGLKNEIGTFHHPLSVVVDASLFATLPREQLLSGYAEMVKTALISDRAAYEDMVDFDSLVDDRGRLTALTSWCVERKMQVVAADPEEHGVRKTLNFGHTVGHAIETAALLDGHEILHGHAVALGMLHELRLSSRLLGFPREDVERYAECVASLYAGCLEGVDLTPGRLVKLMAHDKKNTGSGRIALTMLRSVGDAAFGDSVSPAEMHDYLAATEIAL